MQVDFVDTSGEELSFHSSTELLECDAVMICFAIDNQASFNHVQIWRDKMIAIFPDVPMMLVATKSDLRNADRDDDPR